FQSEPVAMAKRKDVPADTHPSNSSPSSDIPEITSPTLIAPAEPTPEPIMADTPALSDVKASETDKLEKLREPSAAERAEAFVLEPWKPDPAPERPTPPMPAMPRVATLPPPPPESQPTLAPTESDVPPPAAVQPGNDPPRGTRFPLLAASVA